MNININVDDLDSINSRKIHELTMTPLYDRYPDSLRRMEGIYVFKK